MARFIQCVQNQNIGANPIETIKAIKDAGFDGVFLQWYDRNWSVSQEEQLKLCQDNGLSVEFFHLGYDNANDLWLDTDAGEKTMQKYIKNLKIMAKNGVFIAVMHLALDENYPATSEIGLKRFRKIIEFAQSLNIKIAIENVPPINFFKYAFDNLNYDNLGLCFDSGHWHCYFDDNLDLTPFKNKIFAVHLHDNDASDDQHLNVGDGTVDWKKVKKMLKMANYNGPITLESCYQKEYLATPLTQFYKNSLAQAKKEFN